MRIGIDARLCGKKHGGIGRYIENLIAGLLSTKSTQFIEWVLFFHSPADLDIFKETFPKLKAELDKAEIHFFPIRHYSVKEQLQAPTFFSGKKLDLLHVPHFNIPLLYSGKFVVTIHDLLWHEYKGSHVTTLPWGLYQLKHVAYRVIASQAIRNAERIFVPAETIKTTVDQYFPGNIQKIVVTHEGASPTFQKKTAIGSVKSKQLMYVGSLYPHKNVEIILQSLSQLPEFNLILAGSRDVFQNKVKQRVKELGLANRVEFKHNLSDADIFKLFQQSFALIQPSFSEGFGLTGVEAMAAGLPVLASDIPIFKEIYQDAAVFFPPKDIESFVKAVHSLQQPDVYKKHQARAMTVAHQYSWEKMAKQTFDTYLKIL